MPGLGVLMAERTARSPAKRSLKGQSLIQMECNHSRQEPIKKSGGTRKNSSLFE
jgi:hypothetical protein